MKFTKIGVGFPTTSKTGKKYINLRLDEDAMKVIYPEDLKKICLFESKSKNGNTYYQVTAPMKDDYEPRTQTPAPVDRTQGRQDS
jgi:hypothetical protein